MKRRFLWISEHASPLALLGGTDAGGQNVYVDQIPRQLAASGHQVDILTRRDRDDLPPLVSLCDGVRVVNVPAGPPAPVRKEELLPYMGEFTRAALRYMRRQKVPYDLVHANFFMSALVAADLKRATGKPFVVTFHALGRVRRIHQGGADSFPDERLAIEDRVVAEADRVIAECPQDEDDLVDLYAADRERITTIPCGFDSSEFWPIDQRAARAELGLPLDEAIVLQLGRMVPRKGVDNVIRGLARLRRRLDAPVRLVIVGGESRVPDPKRTPEIGRLQALAVKEGVADAVTFIGSRGRQELRYYYAAADVFVSTPWYEPFGITPLEAMACGTPVIGSAVGGIKSTVRDGETGYLVPPNDPEALAARLSDLLAHPALRDEFSRNAITHVNARYTWSGVSQAVADLYEDVLDVRRRSVAADVMRAARQVAAGATADTGFPAPTY
jgi:glycosyltransferase involved in cell wall biosynthesis